MCHESIIINIVPNKIYKYTMKIRAKFGVLVYGTARCAQFVTCRSVGQSPGVSWVVSIYIGMVPRYGEVGVRMALASVEGIATGVDNPVRPWHSSVFVWDVGV